MYKQLRLAAILAPLTMTALWTPAIAQTTVPAPGAAAAAPLDRRTFLVRLQGSTTASDAQRLRNSLYGALDSIGATLPQAHRFSITSFTLRDGRFDATISCNFERQGGRGSIRGGRGGGGIGPATELAAKDLGTAAQCVAFLKEQFALPPDQAAWSPQDRAARIAKIDNELLPINTAQAQLGEAVRIARIDGRSLIADGITALRNEIQSVRFGLRAKAIRRTALEMALSEQQKRAADLGTQAEKQDPLVAQLRQLAELRQHEVVVQQRLVKNGEVASSAVETAEAALAEAQVRLAQRINELHGGGSKELINRLTEELAMVSVDLTELEMRLKDLSEQMSLYHRARDDSEAMKQLMQIDPEFAQFLPAGATTRNANGIETQRTSASLDMEWFLLSVSDLNFTDTTPAQGN